jgi:hypothetical protein
VRRSAGAVDRFEGVAEFAGDRVGGGDLTWLKLVRTTGIAVDVVKDIAEIVGRGPQR